MQQSSSRHDEHHEHGCRCLAFARGMGTGHTPSALLFGIRSLWPRSPSFTLPATTHLPCWLPSLCCSLRLSYSPEFLGYGVRQAMTALIAVPGTASTEPQSFSSLKVAPLITNVAVVYVHKRYTDVCAHMFFLCLKIFTDKPIVRYIDRWIDTKIFVCISLCIY